MPSTRLCVFAGVQLLTSHFIAADGLLKLVPHAELLEIQALLHKHLGDHKEALRSDLTSGFFFEKKKDKIKRKKDYNLL